MLTAESDSDDDTVLYNVANGNQYIELQNLDEANVLPEVNSWAPRNSGVGAVFANLLKCYTGAGILSLPFAFRYSGIIAGVLCLLLVSVMCTVSMVCLVKCKNHLSLKSSANLTYSDVVLLLLGRRWSFVLDIIIITFQFGCVIIYFVFVSENLTPYFSHIAPAPVRWSWMAFIAPFYILLSWIRSMRKIGIISFVAEITILGGITVTAIIGCIQLSREVVPGLAYHVDVGPPWRTLPLMFGMAAFAFEGAGVVIPTQSSMKKPELFNKVLVVVLVCATLMYITFGVLLYLAFGPDTGFSTGQVTENLEQFASHMPDTNFWHSVQVLVKLSLVFSIGMSVPVQLIVVLEILEKICHIFVHLIKYAGTFFMSSFACKRQELFKPGRLSRHNLHWKQNLLRGVVSLTGLALAASGISFGHMVSLTGAFSGTLIQFIFPTACYLTCFKGELSVWQKGGMWFLAVGGSVFGCLATYVTLVEMFS